MSISEVNTATKEQLMEIKGIGDKKASAIITLRNEGNFTSFDDVQKVSGIGKKMIENIQNDVKSKSMSEKAETNSTAK
jgi:competence protein ComEA